MLGVDVMDIKLTDEMKKVTRGLYTIYLSENVGVEGNRLFIERSYVNDIRCIGRNHFKNRSDIQVEFGDNIISVESGWVTENEEKIKTFLPHMNSGACGVVLMEDIHYDFEVVDTKNNGSMVIYQDGNWFFTNTLENFINDTEIFGLKVLNF